MSSFVIAERNKSAMVDKMTSVMLKCNPSYNKILKMISVTPVGAVTETSKEGTIVTESRFVDKTVQTLKKMCPVNCSTDELELISSVTLGVVKDVTIYFDYKDGGGSKTYAMQVVWSWVSEHDVVIVYAIMNYCFTVKANVHLIADTWEREKEAYHQFLEYKTCKQVLFALK